MGRKVSLIKTATLSHNDKKTKVIFLMSFFVIAFFLKTSPSSWERGYKIDNWNSTSRLATIESLIERGTFAIDQSQFVETGDKVMIRGHFYSDKPPVLSILLAPVYGLLHYMFGLHFHNDRPFDVTHYLFLLFTNGVLFAALMALFYRLLLLFSPPSFWKWLLLIGFGLGTYIFPYSLVLNNHIYSAFFLLLAYYLLLKNKIDPTDSFYRFLWIGLALGVISVLEIIPVMSVVPLFFIYVLFQKRYRSKKIVIPLVLGLILPIVFHIALNIPLTGDIKPASMHPEFFDYPGSAFNASNLTGFIHHASIQEFLLYCYNALLGSKGFFLFSPILLLALLFGLFQWKWWKDYRKEKMLLLAIIIVSFIGALLFTNNLGGWSFGFRHTVFLTPLILSLLLPLESYTSRLWKIFFIIFTAVSILSMIILGALNPWTGYTGLSKIISVSLSTPLEFFIPFIHLL